MTPQEEYRTIPLTQGQVAIVDAADYEWLMQWKWRARWVPLSQKFYAVRSISKRGERMQMWHMSREILGLSDKSVLADHIDGNTLDNRRSNLRAATHTENMRNRGAQKNSGSGIKGVRLIKGARPAVESWQARIRLNGKALYLGRFRTPQEAHQAYCAAAIKYHGEFARTA